MFAEELIVSRWSKDARKFARRITMGIQRCWVAMWVSNHRAVGLICIDYYW
jgi:hypothetical protein